QRDGRGAVGRAVVNDDRLVATRQSREHSGNRVRFVEDREHDVGHRQATYPGNAGARSGCCLRLSKLRDLTREIGNQRRYIPILPAGGLDTVIAERPQETTATRLSRATVAVLAAWVTVILAAHVLLERLQAAGANIRINAAPLVGTFELRVSGRVLVAVVLGTAVAAAGPR